MDEDILVIFRIKRVVISVTHDKKICFSSFLLCVNNYLIYSVFDLRYILLASE